MLTAFLLVAFALVVWRGLRIAARAADDYGTYLAIGITMFIGLQAFTNLAVAMGMLPTKGLVLPFISYGGSSLLVNCAAVGILLNVSRERDVEEVGEPEAGPAESTKKTKTSRGDAGAKKKRRRRNGRRPGEAAGGAVAAQGGTA